MHGLTGGGWKRSVGHGHRSEAARRGNPGKSGCGTHRRATSPHQPPTLLRVREACLVVERRYGLRVTAPGDRTAGRRPTRAENEHARRRGWEEPARNTLRRAVHTAAAGASSEREFFARLE